VGPLLIDRLHREAHCRGELLDLTPKEFEFVSTRAPKPTRLHPAMILENVSGPTGRDGGPLAAGMPYPGLRVAHRTPSRP